MEYQGRWYKKVTLRGNDYIYANFGTRGVIRVYNADGNTKSMLKKYGARKLANECKYIYRTIHGEDINISTMSLAWEIIGHVFPNEIVRAINIAVKENTLSQAFLDFVLAKTEIIDCGDNQICTDKNRFIWDGLAKVTQIMENIFRKIIKIDIF